MVRNKHTLLKHTLNTHQTFQSRCFLLRNTLFLTLSISDHVEAELLHTFTKVYKFDTWLLMVRLAVLTAVTLTVPIVLFPVSTKTHRMHAKHAFDAILMLFYLLISSFWGLQCCKYPPEGPALLKTIALK